MQKREKLLSIMWRLIYPALLFFGIELCLETCCTTVWISETVSQYPELANNMDEVQKIVLQKMNMYGQYIVLVRTAIIVPIAIYFIKKDKLRDMLYGRCVNYSGYDKKWLLLLPVIGFLGSISLNLIVPWIFEGLQLGINEIAYSWFGKADAVDFISSYQTSSSKVYALPVWLQLVAAGIAAPVCEELIFRGLIYKRLREHLKVAPSMIFSAVVFGLAHGNALQFLYGFLMGLVFAYIVERFKSVWASVIVHVGANVIAIILTNTIWNNAIGLTIGNKVLISVATLAGMVALLKLIDMKVVRKPVMDVTQD